MKIRVCEDWRELAPFRGEWNRLLSCSPSNEIFLSFDFLRTWHESRTRPCRLHVILVETGGGLSGIAPFMITERHILGVRLITVEFLGTPYIDYADFLYEDWSALPLVWEAVSILRGKVDAAYLQQIPESSPTVPFLEAQTRVLKRKSADCMAATLPVGQGVPIRSFLKKPDYARHLRRHIRLLERKGELTLDTYSKPGDVLDAVDILIRQHRSRWKATDTPSRFNSPSFVELYRNLSSTLASTGNLLVAVLKLDEVPLACHWGFIYGPKFLLHTTSVNVDYWNSYCGSILVLKIEQYLAEARPDIRCLDFMRGAEHYKSYFADQQAVNVEFIRTLSLKAVGAMRPFFWGSDLARKDARIMDALRKYHKLVSQVYSDQDQQA